MRKCTLKTFSIYHVHESRCPGFFEWVIIKNILATQLIFRTMRFRTNMANTPNLDDALI